MAHEVKKVSEKFQHKMIFREGDGVLELKASLGKIPETAEYAGVEECNEFAHEIIFLFYEERIVTEENDG